MIDSKLSDLAILSIEKEIAQEIEDDNMWPNFGKTDLSRKIEKWSYSYHEKAWE